MSAKRKAVARKSEKTSESFKLIRKLAKATGVKKK